MLIVFLSALLITTLLAGAAQASTPWRDKLVKHRTAANQLRESKCIPRITYPVKARHVAPWNLRKFARAARADWIAAMFMGQHCGPLSVYAYNRIPEWVRSAFITIHGCEGSWTDTGDPYWGGLQMDEDFMDAYGADAQRKYGGFAHLWPPHVQIIVAWRAWRARGFYPWPACARRAGLI